uniref:BAR domain-containing protein n=1 Tax=Angiostrongylus cantonensis TaxID=6313 RepID=A0A0K0DJS3_ANGCA
MRDDDKKRLNSGRNSASAWPAQVPSYTTPYHEGRPATTAVLGPTTPVQSYEYVSHFPPQAPIAQSPANVSQQQFAVQPSYSSQDVQKYDIYRDSVVKLVELLEAVNQPNPAVLATGQFLQEDKAGQVAKICRTLEQAAKTKRDYQIKRRACIRHLRRFDSLEYKVLLENRENFNQAKANMDLAKHEVKQAKTTEQIERRAVLYQQQVEVFDEKCNKFIKLLEELPSIKSMHSKDLTDLAQCSREYHQAMSRVFK